MNPVLDLNEYLERLSNVGMVTRVSRPVDSKHELASLAVESEKKREGAVFFESLKGHNISVVTNLYSEVQRICLAFGTEREELHEHFSSAMNKRIKPSVIEEGKVQEKEARTLDDLPIPHNTPHDAGRYVTGILTAQEAGVRIFQFLRAQVKAPDKLCIRVDPGRRLWDVVKDRDTLDVALIIGAPPSVEFAAAVRGSAFDKLELAGALQDAPVELVRCEKVNCEVPSRAQIVIEGVMDKRKTEPEGPFAEFSGYYSPSEPMPIVEVKKIVRRHDSVYRTIIGGSMEHIALNNVAREASIYDSLKRAVPGIVDIYLPPFGCGFIAFLSVRNEYVMMAKNALLTAMSAHPVVKYAVVVDEDVNIRDEREVLWAIATRSGGDDDLVVVRGAFNHALDPASLGGFVNKVGLDATFPPDKKALFKKVEYAELGKR